MKNDIDKTDNGLKILNLVVIEMSLVSSIYADVVNEAAVVFHVFVVLDFDELTL